MGYLTKLWWQSDIVYIVSSSARLASCCLWATKEARLLMYFFWKLLLPINLNFLPRCRCLIERRWSYHPGILHVWLSLSASLPNSSIVLLIAKLKVVFDVFRWLDFIQIVWNLWFATFESSFVRRFTVLFLKVVDVLVNESWFIFFLAILEYSSTFANLNFKFRAFISTWTFQTLIWPHGWISCASSVWRHTFNWLALASEVIDLGRFDLESLCVLSSAVLTRRDRYLVVWFFELTVSPETKASIDSLLPITLIRARASLILIALLTLDHSLRDKSLHLFIMDLLLDLLEVLLVLELGCLRIEGLLIDRATLLYQRLLIFDIRIPL